jgi:mono/diheme cytochrome c family protein
MKKNILWVIALGLTVTGCSRRKTVSTPEAKTFGAAITVISGDKQLGTSGAILDQPLVVQVNDSQENPVTGAPVSFQAGGGAVLTPAAGLTDASGQFTTSVTLGQTSGRYQITAATRDNTGKPLTLAIEETALGFQETWGRELNMTYCDRCHNPESTRERVSNFDNLTPKPHAFTDGIMLNKLTDADLTSLITHGGVALNESPEMPPYGYTLSNVQVQALVAYIRAVADPPYRTAGAVYAEK